MTFQMMSWASYQVVQLIAFDIEQKSAMKSILIILKFLIN